MMPETSHPLHQEILAALRNCTILTAPDPERFCLSEQIHLTFRGPSFLEARGNPPILTGKGELILKILIEAMEKLDRADSTMTEQEATELRQLANAFRTLGKALRT